LFPKLKEFTKFVDDEDVIHTTSALLKDQDEEFFYNGIQASDKHWAKGISVGRDYVEVTEHQEHILLLTV